MSNCLRSISCVVLLIFSIGCSQNAPTQGQAQQQQAQPHAQSTGQMTDSEALAKAKELEKALKGGGKVSPICSMFTRRSRP